MQEELDRNIKNAIKQVSEAKKYAKLYQDNFKAEADAYIENLKQETITEKKFQDKKNQENHRKIESLKADIEKGNLKDVINKLSDIQQ